MKKRILLTGATSGIGLEIAKGIVEAGHQLIFTARDAAKANSLKNDLLAANPQAEVSYLLCDFTSLASIKTCAEQFLAQYSQLDVLINNAGVWEMERKESQDGIEMNLAVNALAPFLLTNLLLPSLKAAPEGRIINTSSMAHRRNILELNDLEWRNHPYNGVATYSQSKLINLLHSLQWAKELAGTSVTVNAVHPGYVQSNLFNNMGQRDWSQVPPASDGARSALYAALSPDLTGVSGKYIYHEREDQPTPMAQDEALAQKVWEISEQYVSSFLLERHI